MAREQQRRVHGQVSIISSETFGNDWEKSKIEQKILSGGASVPVIGWSSLDWTFGMNTRRFVFPTKCVLSPQTSHPEIH